MSLPIGDPLVEITNLRSLHQLKASFELFIDPARHVLQSFRSQATVFSEVLVNRNRIAVFKMLDDHVKQSSYLLSRAVPRNLCVLRVSVVFFYRRGAEDAEVAQRPLLHADERHVAHS